ncbi:uncharacterized protein JCM15063_003603 [Sporobolomyces koalae]|uniref:uncharacterized protein n=1 Tax=Sporobolomyces koalae TaxID=500713 RepID=UPI00317528F8
MEIVSPIAFVLSLPLARAFAAPRTPLEYLATVVEGFNSLPVARKCLVGFFVGHYANRAVVSTWQNPSRARMNILVPLSAIVFNIMNGSTMGTWVGAGPSSSRSGLEPGRLGLFLVGSLMWFIGFSSNIYHDHVLYALKRDKLAQTASRKKKQAGNDPKDRYSIPRAGLYRYMSHPSYSCEWFEWLGFLICALSLSHTTPFPVASKIVSPHWMPLVPLAGWYLQPPALFLWQEIALMLPRARAGHRWYEKTFGEQWHREGAKWVVLPGLY